MLPEAVTSVPLVSVIVLNLNGEKVIGQCLNQLFAQTYPNFEVIVVDNHSTDNSLAVIESFKEKGNLTIVQSPSNRGCPGGRNLGTQYVHGEFVAFIDNDGYAYPNWLEAVLRPFQQAPEVGAVASVVFFNRNRVLLNGAGGTVNLQGYGGDYCYHEPHEFAQLPTEVLYPMGCGMTVRRAVLEQIGPLDEALLNYYDDTELGMRVWLSGYRVVVAPGAFIDHEFNYTTQFIPGRSYLTEKGRIRNALKYFPMRHLGAWLGHEVLHILQQSIYARLQIQAWLWNIVHLRSALEWRTKFQAPFADFERLTHPSWGWLRFSVPIHALHSPKLAHAGPMLQMDLEPNPQLNYGWYWPEGRGHDAFRWTAQRASTVFRLPHATQRLSLKLKTPLPQKITLAMRPWGQTTWVWQQEITLEITQQWLPQIMPCRCMAGDYEFLLTAEKTLRVGPRWLGVAVAQANFE